VLCAVLEQQAGPGAPVGIQQRLLLHKSSYSAMRKDTIACDLAYDELNKMFLDPCRSLNSAQHLLCTEPVFSTACANLSKLWAASCAMRQGHLLPCSHQTAQHTASIPATGCKAPFPQVQGSWNNQELRVDPSASGTGEFWLQAQSSTS
jgi:hypothetical protein